MIGSAVIVFLLILFIVVVYLVDNKKVPKERTPYQTPFDYEKRRRP